MEPDQPLQKYGAAGWILILIAGWVLLSPVPVFPAGPSSDQLYSAGKNCRQQLLKSPKRMKLRTGWETCIRDFSTLVTRYPKDRLVENSLLALGDLYDGLHGYSNRDEDLQKSRDYYHKLISDYPGGGAARTAQKRLNPLKPAGEPETITTLQAIRHWVYPDYIRLVLDMDRDMDYRQEPSNPGTLRIRFKRTRLGPAAENGLADLGSGSLQRMTLRTAGPNAVLLNINTKGLTQAPKILPLSNPDRLVIDLFGRNPTGDPALVETVNPPAPKPSGGSPAYAQGLPLDVRTIMLDPGHGGKDPGAIGRTGLTEKEVVLDIGLRLRTLIRERLKKTVLMTRDDDTFIPLDDRTLIANSKDADLFVSIHVNSHPKRDTRGVEIYHLGEASDRRAMAVAARENNVSLQSLGNLERSVKQILFDLGREYKMDQSQTLAHFTRRSFQTTLEKQVDYEVVDHGVKRAPFYVLLYSNMPSILAEVSFISNSREEQLLRQGPYRQAIAESLFQGILAYLASLKPVS